MSNEDLNICQDPSQHSKSDISDFCQCPPEYYCADISGEACLESISSLISWQHFPRSTSTRSRCDDSSEDFKIKRSVSSSTLSVVQEKEEKEQSLVSSTEYPITKSFAQLDALHYLQIRHVYELFNFMIAHLVCNEPDEPIPFLENLLDKCIKYRDSFGEPPLLFTHHHIKSLYKAFDPFERGQITMEQYKDAMLCLGLGNDLPTDNDGYVQEQHFIFEAERRLIENLDKMFRIPKPWEENRLKWKRKMAKISSRKLEGVSGKKDTATHSKKSSHTKYCVCDGTEQLHKLVCDCRPKPRIKYEPKQLFLDDYTY